MIPTCLNTYLRDTCSGDRNNHLFMCLKHVKRLNPRFKIEELYRSADILNRELQSPLKKVEVRAISRSVYNHDYKSSCFPFRQYCTPATFCPLNRRASKHLTHEGYVKLCYPRVKIRPHDIEDLKGIQEDIAHCIQDSRSRCGINPYIDTILKARGVLVGDKAMEIRLKNRHPRISESALLEWKGTMKTLRGKVEA